MDNDLQALMQQEDEANKKKAMIRSLGAIGDSLSNKQSVGNFYLGQMNQKRDAASQVADAQADAVGDPMSRQAKAFEYLKSKRENEAGAATDKFKQSLRDETSPAAKAYKQMLISNGMDPDTVNGSTAADLDAQGFSPAKMAEMKAKAKFDNEASIKKFMLENGVRTKEKREEKTKENDNKDAQALEGTLSKGWAARGGQAGSVQGKILAAERAEQLLEQGKLQPGGLDSRQLEELAQSTANLLGGGAQASARVDALLPHTFWGSVQSAKEWASNNPQGRDQTAFTDRMAETVAREKALAIKQMQQYQQQSLPAHERLKKSNPELYNSILSAHGLGAGSGQFDDDVLKYAKEHNIPPQEAQNVKNARMSKVGQN